MEQPVPKPVPKGKVRLVCFTIFDMNFEFMQFEGSLQFWCYGKEICPDTQREHFQCFGYSEQPHAWSWWLKLLRPHHFEFCRGNLSQNEKYCKKDGQWNEFGVKPMGDGKRRDLAVFCEAVVKGTKVSELAKEMPTVFVQYHNGLSKLAALCSVPYQHDKVRGIWIYGVPGAGKSYYVRDKYPDLYIKAQNKWFDGYDGQRTILLDDFGSRMFGYYLKIWTDRYACTGEVKGGTVNLQHHEFIITSNYAISELYGDDPQLLGALKRRFTEVYMGSVYKPD